jgi:hypothetical protein
MIDYLLDVRPRSSAGNTVSQVPFFLSTVLSPALSSRGVWKETFQMLADVHPVFSRTKESPQVFLSSAQKFVRKFHDAWFQLGLGTLSVALDAAETGVNPLPKYLLLLYSEIKHS